MKKHLLLFALLLLISGAMFGQSYHIIVSAEPVEGGSPYTSDILDHPQADFNNGDRCTLHAHTNVGYTFVNWTTGTVTVNDSVFSFQVTQDSSFVANFTQTSYAITYTDDGHGTCSGPDAAHYGDNVTVTVMSDTGYELNSLTYNGTDVPIVNGEYKFPMPASNVTVNATFTQTNYAIYYNNDGHGTCSGPDTANYDDQVTVSVTPAAGYELATLTYTPDGGMSIDITSSMQFTMPASAVTVSATFKQIHIIIETPDTICSGESLNLTEPEAPWLHGEWQLSSTGDFEPEYTISYTNQALDASYNGWYLRYHFQKDIFGHIVEWNSNTVQITVNSLKGLTLEGNESVNTYQEVEYQVIDSINNYANYSYDWRVSDSQADITIIDNNCKVTWKTIGVQQMSVIVTDTITGCTDTLTLIVEVSSCIDESDIHEIEAKSYTDNTKYILIYPNPMDTYIYQWYLNDTLIQNANKQYYYKQGGLPDGNYKVCISIFKDDRCSAFSPVFLVENNQNHHSSNRLSIYPNPAHSNDELFIVNDSENEAQLTIYSIDGRLLHSQMVTTSPTTIELHLQQGVYVAYLSDKSGLVKVEKIIIQ